MNKIGDSATSCLGMTRRNFLAGVSTLLLPKSSGKITLPQGISKDLLAIGLNINIEDILIPWGNKPTESLALFQELSSSLSGDILSLLEDKGDSNAKEIDIYLQDGEIRIAINKYFERQLNIMGIKNTFTSFESYSALDLEKWVEGNYHSLAKELSNRFQKEYLVLPKDLQNLFSGKSLIIKAKHIIKNSLGKSNSSFLGPILSGDDSPFVQMKCELARNDVDNSRRKIFCEYNPEKGCLDYILDVFISDENEFFSHKVLLDGIHKVPEILSKSTQDIFKETRKDGRKQAKNNKSYKEVGERFKESPFRKFLLSSTSLTPVGVYKGQVASLLTS